MKSIPAIAMYLFLLVWIRTVTTAWHARRGKGSQARESERARDIDHGLAGTSGPDRSFSLLRHGLFVRPGYLWSRMVDAKKRLLADSSPLNNQALFWVMATLTVVTSLPRLSKVSKPIALAAEKLETYSVAIIYLSMRLFANPSSPVVTEVDVALASFDPVQLPIDLLMALGAAINIIVINAIKLFIELLVWIIPFPSSMHCSRRPTRAFAWP